RRKLAPLAMAGVILGMIGLTSPEYFFAGAGAAILAVALGPGARRAVAGVALIGPAIGLFALWAVPLALSAHRLGGLGNTTTRGPKVLSVGSILWSWGLVAPLAVAGLVAFVLRWGGPGLLV